MSILLENPFVIIVSALVVLLIVYYFWTQTRLRWILHLMVAIALVAIGLVIIERMVVTDREAIKTTLTDLAERVEANDVDGALSYFSQSAKATRDHAAREMPGYKFTTCRIVSYQEFAPKTDTGLKTCDVTFTVFVDVEAPSFHGFKGRAGRTVTLKLQKEPSGAWKVLNYSHYDPRER